MCELKHIPAGGLLCCQHLPCTKTWYALGRDLFERSHEVLTSNGVLISYLYTFIMLRWFVFLGWVGEFNSRPWNMDHIIFSTNRAGDAERKDPIRAWGWEGAIINLGEVDTTWGSLHSNQATVEEIDCQELHQTHLSPCMWACVQRLMFKISNYLV